MSTRSLTIVGVLVLLSWLAWAGTPWPPPVSPAEPVASRTPQNDRATREIAREADGLWDRLRASPVPRQPTRNPFSFATVSIVRPKAEPAAAPAPVEAPAVEVPVVDPPPPFKLVGIAENGEGDTLVREAIVAGLGKLFIVKIGDDVTSRFKVAAIGPDVVELSDNAGGPPLRLALK